MIMGLFILSRRDARTSQPLGSLRVASGELEPGRVHGFQSQGMPSVGDHLQPQDSCVGKCVDWSVRL